MIHRRSPMGRLTPLLILSVIGLLVVGAIIYFRGRVVDVTGVINSTTIATPLDAFAGTPTGASLATVADQAASTPTATVMSDTLIPIPDEIAHHNTTGDPVTLRSTSKPPLITQQQAMEIVAMDSPWGLGGNWHGYEVTVQAWYGSGTVGRLDARGDWLGPVNVPLSPVQTLDNIKNRPIWLLAYSNVPGVIASGCPGCPDPPVYTHDVYAVDAQSQSVIWFASYPTADEFRATPSTTPAVSDLIPLPSSKFGELTLVRSGSAPTISSAEALKIVRDSIAGPLTDQITSTFGLATFGQRDAEGRWVGDMNVRLANGEIIDHIENRPMWIIDVAGIEGAVGGEPTEPYNHVVFAVDIESRGVVFVWSYPGA